METARRGAHLRVQQKRRAIGGTRPRSLRVIQRDEVLLPRIEALEVGHPFWGDRRIWAHVRCVEQLPGNKKRVLRVMREHRLLVPPDLRLNAERTPMRDKPTPTHPNAWWGIDMTEVLVEDFGWVSIVLGLGWYAKKIVGYHAGMQGAARHWLAALHMAVNGPFPAGVEGKRLALMSDNGCQPTSIAFMKTCSTLGISQAFTSDHNPKGNAETERVIRTLKEECLWFREWPCPVELFQALEHWISYDNEPYLHSALAEKTPAQFERDYDNGQRPPFLAA